MTKVKRFRADAPEADDALRALTASGKAAVTDAEAVVRPILDAVRKEGDAALLRYTREFDGVDLDAGALSIPREEMARAAEALSVEVCGALSLAAQRIRTFHQACLPQAVRLTPSADEELALLPTPLRRAGLYAPGGGVAYPSTVLMNAIPAQVAGVEEIILCTPPGPDGRPPAAVLAAAQLAGVGQVICAGGAQAIAAMAYGTETVPAVDKIAGPGNVYVSAAKRLVRGEVEVDKEAGPSEVVVVIDDAARAEWAAADMIAQAEHDPGAMAVGVAIGKAAADALEKEVAAQLAQADRRETIEKALSARGAVIEAADREGALAVAERLAPEHLELMIENPEAAADQIRSAGAIFLGPWSPVAAGDYLAGVNHVLPTGGAARFASPLGVLDFMKWTSRVRFGPAEMSRLAGPAAALADLEGLPAHARALRLRLEGGENAPDEGK